MPPPRRLAWVFNLDADLELAASHRYTPRRTVRDAMAAYVPIVARSLLGPEDVIVDESSPALFARGLLGRAFCPTPRARAILERAGADLEAAPPFEVLRRVNSRAFASSLGATLPGGAFVVDLEEARAKLGKAPPCGDAWRVKRAFGMTGRGQRVVRANGPTEPDLAFVRAGLDEGGVQIEPSLSIVKEYAIHGMLAASGELELGAVVEQRCDARGAWLSTAPLASPTAEEGELSRQLEVEGRRVAAALTAAGYFGPFGVDAYTYRGPMNAIHVQPRSEINARYSMGFAVGLGRIRSA